MIIQKCIFHALFHWKGIYCDQTYLKTCLAISIWPPKPLKTAKNVNFWKMEKYGFWPKLWHFLAKRWSKTMYLGNIHSMSLVPVTFGNFFFQILQNCTFWAKLIRGKMAWIILLYSAIFFCFKNWCKITSQKKSSLTSALSIAGL